MDTVSTLGMRIRRVRRHYGLRQEEFGKKIGISGNRVSEIENNKGGTSASVLEELCRSFPVSHEWLLTGNGSMLRNKETGEESKGISERLTLLESRIGWIINVHENDDREPSLISVPLYSSAVPAGMPAVAAEEVETYLDFPRSWTGGRKNVYALKVSGDSMMDIGIMPGDTLLVESRETARDGQVVIASLNSEVTVKTLCISDGGHVSLAPENRKYRPIPVTPESDFRIMGVVLAALRQYW
ncbi:helix-turn-helix domain-containing protein [Chlorobium phaeovibrioides]|uniref:Helix-turn-helix domain-containing protein n=1 Tax=Chlorobium phaeovibrioides TaxID=1094 RepID=A0A5M8IAX8_CHLPH|nr:XRE family transcriptional regulator [Chlorobium phaeovibrioides]KAA6232596.1 helix-turn-helix domain-containing protein [Chlorobium phaeovibrioides]